MRHEDPPGAEPLQLDLRHPSPALRRLMQLLLSLGLLAIAIGLWQLGAWLLEGDLPPLGDLREAKASARWLIGGLLLAALGCWDR